MENRTPAVDGIQQQPLPPPIVTADNAPISVGMVLYQTVNTNYYGNNISKSQIAKSEVIYVHLVNRYFITRCAKGCETKVKMTEGCRTHDSHRYFSRPENAVEVHVKMRAEQIKNVEQSIVTAQQTLKILSAPLEPEYV